MMEKSSTVILSEDEKKQILGSGGLTKTAGKSSDPKVPERMQGWYSHDELKDIANGQD